MDAVLHNTVSRAFSANAALPGAAADFAVSAVLARLGPKDWQVSEDVGAACTRLVSGIRDSNGSVGSSIIVTVEIAAAHIAVTVANAAGRSDSEVVIPRRPFTKRS